MYKINIKITQNSEPWNKTIEERLQIILQAKKKGKKIALILYELADTSTFRYRAYNVLQRTIASEYWQSIYFFGNEIDQVLKLLPEVHLLIFARYRWTHDIDKLIHYSRCFNVKVLFDTDDLICDINYLNLVTNTLNVDLSSEVAYDFWFACISRLSFTASKVDGFICTNSFLGEKLKERYNKEYCIIRNSINDEQKGISEKCLKIKNKLNSNKPFTIGYFSGTPSHINDFKVIYMEILQLLIDFSDINLLVVGFMEFPQEMQPFIDQGRIRYSPLVNFIELQRLVAEVDINIVPLVVNSFTNCKSELKFFESAIVNTLTVASPNFTYKKAIKDGYNGFLCNEGQWYQTIKSIYKKEIAANEIINNAREYSLNNYYGDTFLKEIENSYDTMMEII